MHSTKTDKQHENRQDLKKNLGHGDLGKIAKLADVGISTVWRWFEGNNDNADVERAYQALIEDKKAKLNERLNGL